METRVSLAFQWHPTPFHFSPGLFAAFSVTHKLKCFSFPNQENCFPTLNKPSEVYTHTCFLSPLPCNIFFIVSLAVISQAEIYNVSEYFIVWRKFFSLFFSTFQKVIRIMIIRKSSGAADNDVLTGKCWLHTWFAVLSMNKGNRLISFDSYF